MTDVPERMTKIPELTSAQDAVPSCFCRPRLARAASALFVAATLFATAWGQTPAPELLRFSADTAETFTRTQPDANDANDATLRSLHDDVHVTALHLGIAATQPVITTRSFELRVPDRGPTLRAENLEHETVDGFDHLYRFDATTGDETSLVIDGDKILGWLRNDGQTWRLVPLKGGQTALVRYDDRETTAHTHEDPDRVHEHLEATADHPTERLRRARAALAATAEDETTVDILVLYTPAASARVGSEIGSMRMLISQSFINSNRVFKNSGIDTRLRLVHAEEVEHTESAKGMLGDFCLLAINPTINKVSCEDPDLDDSALDEAQELREEHQADLVSLIVDHYGDGPAGLAQLLGIYSIISAKAQAGSGYIFSHEIGHNLRGEHNPGQMTRPPYRPYGHGRCNTEEGWRTLMSSGTAGPPDYVKCTHRLPLLSGPNIMGPNGTPTGDTHTHNVARLFTETTPIIAKYRAHKQPGTKTHLVPFIPATDAANGTHAFVRIIDYTGLGGLIPITVIDDDGQEHETWLALEPGTAAHFNSRDLEQGHVKGLGPGVGANDQPRRLVLKTDLDVSVHAYARTADGFVTSLHHTAPKWTTATGTGAHIEFFNPGSNRTIASILRMINHEDRDVTVTVHGYDDRRRQREVRELSLNHDHATLTLGPKEARNLMSWELEEGPDGTRGGIGDGNGKWTLVVSADGDIEAMSLLQNEAGYITNVSQ